MRLQIDTVPALDKLMDELTELGGFSSKKDLFNNVLTILGWALKEAAKGRMIASVDEAGGSYKELQMPALMNAARAAPESRGSIAPAAA